MAGSGRTNADAALIGALASGQTVAAAARTARVSERTAHRRLADPGFRRAVSQTRAELLAQAVGQLAEATTAAVGTLRALLDAEAESVRLSAARAILDGALKGVEFTDLSERVQALEDQAEAVKPALGQRRWSV